MNIVVPVSFQIMVFLWIYAQEGPEGVQRRGTSACASSDLGSTWNSCCVQLCASACSFDKAELLECIRRLVEVDQDWVPGSTGSSLYVRPVLIGNEVGQLWGLGSHTWGAGCLPEGEGPGT